jgi:uncharacterized protein YceH (UPF0502 family)
MASMDNIENLKLSAEAVRVLGVLLEKEKTTPDNYPLTLNSLVSGCNQSTNRNPVVAYDEMTIERGLSELRDKSLALRGVYAGSRVPKHRHGLNEVMNLSEQAQAVLTVLLLRGEQTLGEIKQRTERMFDFSSLEVCDVAVDELASFYPPLAIRIERIPGHKEGRITHTLLDQNVISGESVEEDSDENVLRPSFQLIEGAKSNEDTLLNEDDVFFESHNALEKRVEMLEKETTVLTHEIMALRAEIDDMRDPSA